MTTQAPLCRSLEQYIREMRDQAQRDALAGRLSAATVRQLVVREVSGILLAWRESDE